MSSRSISLPAVLDVIAVIVFIAIGRASHDEAASVTGFLNALWPFLAGAAIGWLATLAWAAAGRPDWNPARLIPEGAVIWIATVVVGMALRAAAGQGVAASFIVVASIATAILLLGWRAVYAFQRNRKD